MRQKLYILIVAMIIMIFSFLSTIEGLKVILRITIPDYTVFKPLLGYNVILGLIGLFTGVMILVKHKKAIMFSLIILIIHSTVLITIIVLYLSSNIIAMHSIQAMMTRVIVWFLIYVMVWKLNKPESITIQMLTNK